MLSVFPFTQVDIENGDIENSIAKLTARDDHIIFHHSSILSSGASLGAEESLSARLLDL